MQLLEAVQRHLQHLHHQEHPGDAHARGLHPCQPHLCCRGNSFRKDQYRYSIYYVMNMRKHRSSWNVHEPALKRKFVKIEKSLALLNVKFQHKRMYKMRPESDNSFLQLFY